MAKNVLILADIRRNKLRNVTFEMLGAAQRIANGGQVSVTLLGHGVDALAGGLGDHGADAVYVVNDSELEKYNPSAYRKAFMESAREANPDVLLFATSAIGRDLAPMVATRLGAGQVSDIVKLETTGESLIFTRPIYAGKAYTKVEVKDGKVLATVRPNNLPPSEGGFGKAGTVKTLGVTFGTEDLTTTVREILDKAATGVDLTEAKVIVSGGRGVKSEDGFNPLQELADVLGGAVGASRGACDAGYCDYSLQIGQTGKVVTPDLYIACGISGAIQHWQG